MLPPSHRMFVPGRSHTALETRKKKAPQSIHHLSASPASCHISIAQKLNGFNMAPTRQRSVRFVEAATAVHEIPHIDDLSQQEVDDVWFTRSDYRRMKKEDEPIIKMLQSSTITPSHARGLENKCPMGAMQSRLAILDGISAVMQEQDRQIKVGRYDPDMMRSKYELATAEFGHEAYERGLSDAKAVQLDLSSDDTSYCEKEWQTMAADEVPIGTPRIQKSKSQKPTKQKSSTKPLAKFQNFVARATSRRR